jgi:hypothetical protein
MGECVIPVDFSSDSENLLWTFLCTPSWLLVQHYRFVRGSG